jgi:hypothetical protein
MLYTTMIAVIILFFIGIFVYVRRAKVKARLTSSTGILDKLESYDNSGNNWHGNMVLKVQDEIFFKD